MPCGQVALFGQRDRQAPPGSVTGNAAAIHTAADEQINGFALFWRAGHGSSIRLPQPGFGVGVK